jgi:hypothetical protein
MVPGAWFHSTTQVAIPDQFIYIWHRVRLGASVDTEVDIYAAAGPEVWVGESKWWRDRPVGRGEVETLLRKAARAWEREGRGLETVRVWFFAHDGFTEDAEALMQERGVLWSTRADLDALLEHVGLRRLPEL